MIEHPYLDFESNPDWNELTPERIRTDITLALEQAEKGLEEIRKQNTSLLILKIRLRHLKVHLRLNQAWTW